MNSQSVSRNIMATAVIIAALIYFSDILKPLTLAIFLWFTIDGLAQFLHARLPFVPRKAAVPFALLVVFVILAFIVAFAAQYVRNFSIDLTAYHARLDAMLATIYSMLPIGGPAPTIGEIFDKVSPSVILSGVGEVLTAFGEEALFVFIYVIGLFAAQAALPKKILNMFPRKVDREHFVAISSAIRTSIEQYLLMQTIISIFVSILCWGLFVLLGLSNPFFWAIITFILTYIPVIGPWVATLLPCLFALVQFTTPIPAVLILVVTHAIQFVAANFVQPRMAGDSLNISALVIFISLAFWGKIWGGEGMFLAVPLSVMLMIVLAQFNSTRNLAIMMSANGNPDVKIAPEAT